MPNKKISELPAASIPILAGTKFEALQGGINVQVDADDMPGSSGGTVTAVTGTTNRITSTAGATPVINIDAAYDAAITAQIAAAAVGLWDDRGVFDASGGAYPTSANVGSGTAGAILKGDIWTISVAGTLPTGQVAEIGDTVRALIDTPGNTQANWGILQNNIGFVPAPIASPTFTGVPAAPTAASGTNTTQLATTAFVLAAQLSSVSTSTAGSTITLDMNSLIQRMHIGSASFATPKTIAMSNVTNSLLFNFIFELTNVAAILTVPADWLMSDLAFDGTSWTPPQIGIYELGGSWNGTSWLVKIQGPFS